MTPLPIAWRQGGRAVPDDPARRIALELGPEVEAEARARAREILVAQLTDRVVHEYQLATPGQVDRASGPTPVGTDGWYLYGLVRHGSSLELAGISGVDGRTLCCLRAAGLAAVASRVNVAVFDGIADEEITPDGRLARLIAAHDQVVSELHRQTSVLPIRFATVLSSPRDVVALLERRADVLLAHLDEVAECDEWTCRLWPATAVRKAVDSRLSGTAYLASKADQLRSRHERLLQGGTLADSIHGQLAPLAESFVDLERSEDQLAAVAYLVTGQRQGEFSEAARLCQMDSERQGARLVLSGPLPPYHFSGVELKEGVA